MFSLGNEEPKKNEHEIKSNNEIKELLGEDDIMQTLKGRKINRLGHVWRSSGIMKDALNWKPEGKRQLGRPKKKVSRRTQLEFSDTWRIFFFF